MILVSYDISADKKRTKFAKYLSKYGHRLQYSLFEIDNSERILSNIIADLNNTFLKTFDETDSVYIIKLNPKCDIQRFGYASHENEDMIIIT